MKKLGVFFTCFDELEAARISLNYLKRIYPDIPVYLVYESDLNFKYLESEISHLKCYKEKDTMSDYLNIEYHDYLSPKDQNAIRTASDAVMDRLSRAIPYLDSEYILMMDPDALVRGPLTIPEGVGLLGCRINQNIGQLDLLNKTLKKYGGKEITAWGATPAIFKVEKFIKARNILLENPDILDELCASFYWFCAHDILLASLFSLIGEEEVFNPDIVQCKTEYYDHNKLANCPLIHQFTKYYPARTHKYKANENIDR
jgi:hypothetical protein